MPTYEYACTSCGYEWEAEQSIKESPLTDCPKCNNATARRQISRGTGFILKGGGWYSDLYASSTNKKPESGSSGSGDKGGGSSDSGSSSSGSSSGSSGGTSGDSGSTSGTSTAAAV